MWLPTPGSTTTRDFRPLPCFGTIEKHYRKRGAYSDISIYMNRLRCIFCSRDCPPLPDLRAGPGQAPLTTSRTAPHDSKTAPTDLRHTMKTAPSEPCPSGALAVISGL